MTKATVISAHYTPIRPGARQGSRSLEAVICASCFDALPLATQRRYRVCESQTCGSTAADCMRNLSGYCAAPEFEFDEPVEDLVSLVDAAHITRARWLPGLGSLSAELGAAILGA